MAERSTEELVSLCARVGMAEISDRLHDTAARAAAAESRAVEMMAQIGALVNRAEQAEFERDGLRVAAAANMEKLRRVRAMMADWSQPYTGYDRLGAAAVLEILDAPDVAKGGE